MRHSLALLCAIVACSDGSKRDGSDSKSTGSGGARSNTAASTGGAGGGTGSSMQSGSGGAGTHVNGTASHRVDAGGAMSGQPNDAGTIASMDGGDVAKASECVVAMHVDTCCQTYEPVTRAQLAANDCLLAVPVSAVLGSDVAQRCIGKSDAATCDVTRCYMRPPPPSRVAVANGAGGCRYADECSGDDDCVIASSSTGCCDCPESMPLALLASNPCLLRNGDEHPGSDVCPGCGLPVQCGMCAPPETAPHCTIRDSFSLCQ